MNTVTATLRTQWVKIRTPSDWLCLIRLLLAPLIWFLAWRRHRGLVAAGVVLSATTDVLDGAIARLTGERSAFGSQFDTVADMAIILSAPAWMAMLYPENFRSKLRPLLMVAGVAAVLLGIEWRKFRRLGNLHIHSARAAAVVAHLYVLVLFITARDSSWLYRLFVLLAGGAAIESAWVIVRRASLDGLSETPLLDDLLAMKSGC